MKLRMKYLYVIVFAVLATALFLPVKSVQAANPTKVTLKENKLYQSYDITGDKKADKIEIKVSRDAYQWVNKVSVWVNEENCFSIDDFQYYGDVDVIAQIYTLKNGKPFLYFYTSGDDGDGPVCGVFQYKSGKLKQIINCNSFLGKKYGMHYNGSVQNVKGNTITVRFHIMSWTTGVSTFQYDFSYKNGTLKRTSAKTSVIEIATHPKVSSLTVRKSMKVYSKTDGKKVLFHLKSGQKVKVTYAYVKSDKFYLKVKNVTTGKSGWIKCYKDSSKLKAPVFKEAFYAG